MIPLGNDLQRVPENQTSKINSREGAGFPQQSAQTSNKPRVDEPRLRKTTTEPRWLKSWATWRWQTHDKLVKDGQVCAETSTWKATALWRGRGVSSQNSPAAKQWILLILQFLLCPCIKYYFWLLPGYFNKLSFVLKYQNTKLHWHTHPLIIPTGWVTLCKSCSCHLNPTLVVRTSRFPSLGLLRIFYEKIS